MTSDHDETQGVSRRKILECMTWAGTGVLWTIAGGVPGRWASSARLEPRSSRVD
jgi:hypothetical protein